MILNHEKNENNFLIHWNENFDDNVKMSINNTFRSIDIKTFSKININIIGDTNLCLSEINDIFSSLNIPQDIKIELNVSINPDFKDNEREIIIKCI